MCEHPTTVDLAYVVRAVSRLAVSVANLRDDVRAQIAIGRRLEVSSATLLTEIRAMHGRNAPVVSLVRDLETHGP